MAQPQNTDSETSAAPLPRIGIAGAAGRMGRALSQAVLDVTGTRPAALFDIVPAADLELVSQDVALDTCDVILDFTVPESSAALAQSCAQRGGPALVIGTTGLSADQEALITKASNAVAILRAANFSLGLNLLLGLIRQAARTLPAAEWDIEIVEAHHKRKVDAPSGTALMLGHAAADGRGASLDSLMAPDRVGITAPRADGDIGFAVVRGGGIIGEHSVILASELETLTLSHSATDRRLFAQGAVKGAVWLSGRPIGLYDMQDVLGLRLPQDR